MVKIYLDTCVWGRPFDDQLETLISEETSAFFQIVLGVDYGDFEVVGSDVLLAEFEDISDELKRDKIRSLASRGVSNSIALDDEIKNAAHQIEKSCKTHGADSLHLASAIAGDATYFITTDYELLRKKRCIKQKFDIDVINPIEFVRKFHGSNGF